MYTFDVIPPLDMAMSVGGDGTLRTASAIGDRGIPILGINTGDWDFSRCQLP